MEDHKLNTSEVFAPPPRLKKQAHVRSMKQYSVLYKQSIEDPEAFWDNVARDQIDFFVPYTQVTSGTLEHGDHAWFPNGKLNVAYNCLDRHLPGKAYQTAILWEGDEPGTTRSILYLELYRDVCRLANALKRLGVRKGDAVCIYLPMVPFAAVAMLACSRIGAVHSVVFAGFSMDSLRDRILDSNSKVVITADEGLRGGKKIFLKSVSDAALKECPCVQNVIVYKHTGGNLDMHPGRDLWASEIMDAERPYCPCEWMDSEDPLFMLYTSGSTGKPKGILHTTAGYLVYASYTQKVIFDYQPGDVFGCMADVGWITGHSYIVYGPLTNGAKTFMFEGTPLYPDPGRYWDMVERHKISIFYTAPTAIRALMRHGPEFVRKYDRSSLKILGSVGEPINPEAWKWYFEIVGDSRCSIVDTYWQTETGGIIVSPLPAITPMKPGSATHPFFGIDICLQDPQTGQVLEGNNVSGVISIRKPWPGLARTVYGDFQRFNSVYLKPYPGHYFTGDGGIRDQDGYYWVTGRVDDVLNVSGHRIGSAEVESALVAYPSVAEAAVVGIPHDIKGTAIFAYVILRAGASSENIEITLMNYVKEHVGSFAKPEEILIVHGVPKTRSGKIMRRILRKIASREFDVKNLGDITTLAEPAVVDELIAQMKELK